MQKHASIYAIEHPPVHKSFKFDSLAKIKYHSTIAKHNLLSSKLLQINPKEPIALLNACNALDRTDSDI